MENKKNQDIELNKLVKRYNTLQSSHSDKYRGNQKPFLLKESDDFIKLKKYYKKLQIEYQESDRVNINKKCGNLKEIKTFIKKEVKKSGFNRITKNYQIYDLWEKNVVKEIVDQTEVLTYKKGILDVSVFSSTLLLELKSFYKKELIDLLNSVFPENMPVIDIKFKPGIKK